MATLILIHQNPSPDAEISGAVDYLGHTAEARNLTDDLNELAFYAAAEIEALIAVARREADRLGGQEGESHVALISCLKRIRRLNSVVISVVTGEGENGRDFDEMYFEVHDERAQAQAEGEVSHG